MINKFKETGKDLGDMSLNIAVKSGLSLIPIVGSALANSYDEINNKIQYERIEIFISELKEEIKVLDKKMNNQVLSEEEYGVIVEKIFESVKLETNPIKRDYFKKIFINGLILNDVKSYRIELFIEILSKLNIVDIGVLRILNEKTNSVPITSITDSRFLNQELYGSIHKIKSYGFVNISMSSMTIGGPKSNVKENVSLNEYGREFLVYCLK